MAKKNFTCFKSDILKVKENVLSSLFVLILHSLALSMTPAGEEYKYSIEPVPDGLMKAAFECWIPSSVTKNTPIKAIICCPNYQADKEIYLDIGWRKFASRENCVLLRHDIRTLSGTARIRLAIDQKAIDAIAKALNDLAQQTGFIGLKNANFVIMGLSQGAAQTIYLARQIPEKTIAAIPLHGAGAGDRIEGEQKTYDIPVLFLLGQKDKFGGTPRIFNYIADRRRTQNCLWAAVVEPNVEHHTLGNQRFVRLWLKDIMDKRLHGNLSVNERPLLQKLDVTKGWLGSHRNTYDMHPLNVRILSYEDFNKNESRSGGFWLPSKEVAEAWKKVSLSGEFENIEKLEEIAAFAHKAVQPVRVDGLLAEWGSLETTVYEAEITPNRTKWNGPDDCSMKFGISYDDNNLYLAIHVDDDQIIFEGKAPWDQDGVEIRLDARPAILRGSNKAIHDFEGFLVIALGPAKGNNHYIYAKDKLPKNTRIAASTSLSSYDVEISIPAAYLNKMQKENWRRFRLNIAVDDIDKDGKSQLWWRPDWRSSKTWFGSGTVVKK